MAVLESLVVKVLACHAKVLVLMPTEGSKCEGHVPLTVEYCQLTHSLLEEDEDF